MNKYETAIIEAALDIARLNIGSVRLNKETGELVEVSDIAAVRSVMLGDLQTAAKMLVLQKSIPPTLIVVDHGDPLKPGDSAIK